MFMGEKWKPSTKKPNALEVFTLLFGVIFWLSVCVTTHRAAFIRAPPVTLLFWVFAIMGPLMYGKYFLDRHQRRKKRKQNRRA